jgi:5-methylcytosine-specific restriction endonuclease McrA
MSINQYVKLYNETSEEESERLKRLPYQDFLRTGYWHIIANHVKHRDGFRCTKCGKLPKFRELLDVHHLTYENHGYEHRTHLKDLITLCQECHADVHGKTLNPIQQKPSNPHKIAIRKQGRKNESRMVDVIRHHLIEELLYHINKQRSRPRGISYLGLNEKQVKGMRVEALIRLSVRLGLKVEIIVS